MSDEFDKEAEREKLREKYEQEQQRRDATEQMSELLLKGATMTNAHCSDCGDPIFRYDGQEFCPTCEKPVDRGEGAGDAGEEGENGAAAGNVEITSPSDDARVQFGGESESEESPDDDAAADAASGETDERPSPDAEPQSQQPTHSAPSLDPSDSTWVDDASGTGAGETASNEPAAAPGDVGATIASARASLARTAARFARAAEQTDDPTVAREHLEAAREAAAALDELD